MSYEIDVPRARRTRSRAPAALALIIGFVLPALAPPATFAQEAESGVEELFGGYVLDEPVSRVKKRIRVAVERSTEELNFIMRGIARKRLRKNNPVVRRLRIGKSGRDLAVSTDGRTVVAPAGGARRAMELSGESVRASYAYEAGRLRQTVEYDRGTRRSTFVLRDDGRLVLKVSLRAELLSRPITYRIRFRRARP